MNPKNFIEDCGPGANTNPLLNYVRTFTDDKSNWQDQYAVQNNYGPLRQSGPPPQIRQQQEKQLLHKFVDNRNQQPAHFSPFPLALQGPRPMWEMEPQQHRPMPYSKEALETQHQGWIADYQQATNHPADFEQAWNRPRPSPHPIHHHHPPQQWVNQYEEEDFDQVYQQVEQRVDRAEWAERFAQEEERKAADDERLRQLANDTFNGLVSGDLKPAEDGTLKDATPGQKFANEFVSSESWADQLHRERQAAWADQFQNFDQGEMSQEEWLQRWSQIQQQSQDWADHFMNHDWDEQLVDQYEQAYNMATRNHRFGQDNDVYEFQGDNPFMNDPEARAKGIQLFNEGRLGESIMALEAAVQNDPGSTEAWTSLGLAQAENDKDRLAIQALEQAVAIDHGNLKALIALAVSQTNEYNKEKAALALHQWLLQNPKYAHFAKAPPPQGPECVRHVTNLFLEAARQSSEVDPDVHTALGLFYNLSCEYAKAVDCFRAALTVRPEDYALWNKLGATMANDFTHRNENLEITIDAYFRALERKPSYTRARSNLGISYLSAHNFIEAAKCFLGALTINNSEHLWSSLRTAFQLMHRPDLVDKCATGNVALFANDFDF